MKKVISILLSMIFVLSVAVMPASADFYDPNKEYDWLYLDKFLEYEIEGGIDLITYTERYYHKDVDGNIDWVWIIAATGPMPEIIGSYAIVLNDKVIGSSYMYPVFFYGYGIYDAKEDKFVDIANIDYYNEYYKYDGLEEYIDKNVGYRIGDADGDDELSVFDATFIQRAVAQLCEFDPHDYYKGYGYLSDMDRDGERSILDATAIQMKLAKIES